MLVIYVAARLILEGQGFSVGMLFAFLSFRQTFTDRAVGLVNQVMQFRFLRLHLDRLSDIVTTPAEATMEAPPLREVEGRIRVKNVSFRYGVDRSARARGHQHRVQAGGVRRHRRCLRAAARPRS